MSELMAQPRANGLAKSEPQQPAIQRAGYGKTGVIFNSWSELWSFAGVLVRSNMAPKGMTTEGAAVALQLGAELGLPPMAAIQNIAVINGRPSLWGDSQLAVCRATGELEVFAEWYEQGGKKLTRNPVTFTDDTTAVCVVKRKGMEPMESAFSVADAKRAKLWGKQGPWTEYPHRMLRNRARSYALRDTFGDALRGLLSSDEAGDVPYVVQSTSLPTASIDQAIEESQEAKGEIIEQDHQQQPLEPGEIPNSSPQEPAAPEQPAGEAREFVSAEEIASTLPKFTDFYCERAAAAGIEPEEVAKLFAGLKVARPLTRLAERTAIVNAILAGDWDFKAGKGR